uniref:Uncharacterized protein n=1 Tax=Phocoena sinus TaxID=42100 RepID=A0A8C9BSE2_PHOSS
LSLFSSRLYNKGSLGALPCHSSGNRLCFPVPHASESCLCGCSLRTKAVLHPRPPPVSLASPALPNLSSRRKQLPSPGIVSFKSQLSRSSPKPKAKAKSQLLSRDRSRASCCATPLRRPVPMGVWPQGFLNPFSKCWPEEPLHTYIPLGGSHFPSQEAIAPVMSLVEGDKPQSSLPFWFK